jgi:hypothetical protein
VDGGFSVTDERVVYFGADDHLLGILSEPDKLAPGVPGVVLLNAGLVHHVGPNRLYVNLARQLAARGMPSLRFDFSGMGDSRTSDTPQSLLPSMQQDTSTALDLLAMQCGSENFILVGHCSGAILASLVSQNDARVKAVALLNMVPISREWSESDRRNRMSQFYSKYYISTLLTSGAKWRRMLTGKISYRKIARNIVIDVLGNKLSNVMSKSVGLHNDKDGTILADSTSGDEIMLRATDFRCMSDRNVDVLLIFSEGSHGIEYLHRRYAGKFEQILEDGIVQMKLVTMSDHTLSTVHANNIVASEVVEFAEHMHRMKLGRYIAEPVAATP